MISIKYDTVEINDGTKFAVRRILDNSTSENIINAVETQGVDGAVVLNDRIAGKTIVIEGHIRASGLPQLQERIDELNELLNRKNKNLDIQPTGGAIRRYENCRRISAIEYDRQYFHIGWVPFRAMVFVPSGVGKATTETTLLTVNNIATERSPGSGSHQYTAAGSATPMPVYQFTVTTKGKSDLLTVVDDDDTHQMQIEMDNTIVNGSVITVDTASQTARVNGDSVSFRGRIPIARPGVNNMHLKIQGATIVLDQVQEFFGTGQVIGHSGGGHRFVAAQSFVPSKSGYLTNLDLYLNKNGSPGSLQVRIFTDNGGRPDQNLVSAETGFLFAAAGVGDGPSNAGVVRATMSPSYYLRAGVTYWMIISTTDAGFGNNYTVWGSGTAGTEGDYPDGLALRYEGSVFPPADPDGWVIHPTYADHFFRTYQGQGGSPDWSINMLVKHTPRYL